MSTDNPTPYEKTMRRIAARPCGAGFKGPSQCPTVLSSDRWCAACTMRDELAHLDGNDFPVVYHRHVLADGLS